jgi:outer membrane protein assembly factor BamE (lipoprotein component of BamABCDE complex)
MNRKSNIIAAALLGLAAAPLGGCMSSTYGEKIEADNVSKIVKGKTTKSEVLAMFGQPMQTVINPTGGRTMMFVYYRSSIGGVVKQYGQVISGKHRADGSTANLTVVLDANDVVTDYEYQPARQ